MTAGLFVLLKEKQEDGFQSKVLRHCRDGAIEPDVLRETERTTE